MCQMTTRVSSATSSSTPTWPRKKSPAKSCMFSHFHTSRRGNVCVRAFECMCVRVCEVKWGHGNIFPQQRVWTYVALIVKAGAGHSTASGNPGFRFELRPAREKRLHLFA